jgi:hypothetical protein
MTRNILPLMTLFTFSLLSCDDETEIVVPPGLVQFEKSELSLAENIERTTITIKFDKQAPDDGEVSVRVTCSDVEKFQFEPAAIDGMIRIPFTKGQSIVSFEVVSLDNDILDGDKTLDFTITSVSQGYKLGITKTISTVWVDDEGPARVNFDLDNTRARENYVSGYPITISFSHVTKADAVVSIGIQSADAVYGTHFITEPAASNGIITLPVANGETNVTFKVFPLDDDLYNQQRSINYGIVDAQGGLKKGEILQHEFRISDDELEGTGKGYEVIAGSWRYKKRYEYNGDGTISKVYWSRYTPGLSEGVHSYVYNTSGQLEKIIESSVRERLFLREGDNIVRSEEYTNGVLTQYTLYGYDEAGNVAETTVHYRQPDGTLQLALMFVYLYHLDHNLYKVLTYTIPKGYDEPVFVGTKTFDHYLDVENQFPMVEILPDQKVQNKLPASYRLEENGHDITYQFDYQFTGEGKPLSRTATSSGGSEIAYYEYY